MKTKNNITTLDQILDKKYGKKGQAKREEWQHQFEDFYLSVLSKKQSPKAR